MKKLLITSLSLTLLLSAGFLDAEIYSWVDKDGKKNFGQEVPKEYQRKSTLIEVKSVNVMDETKVQPTSQPSHRSKDHEPQISEAPDNDLGSLNSCEEKKRAYEESVACYADCRLPKEFSGGSVNNVSACSHCVDVKKPNC